MSNQKHFPTKVPILYYILIPGTEKSIPCLLALSFQMSFSILLFFYHRDRFHSFIYLYIYMFGPLSHDCQIKSVILGEETIYPTMGMGKKP